jgi:signal transduction histidine kinase
MNDSTTHVLLIEDNPGDADLVRLRLLEGNPSVEVKCAQRLSDGLAWLGKTPSPSVVLLDLNLPDSNGANTFRAVLEKAPDVAVVILSGQEDETLAIRALHQGVQDYVVKDDISGSHLERVMRYAIERQALLRSLEMSRRQQLEFKNRFLSHVSHELRTPLTCIHQFVTILLDGIAGEMSADQRDHLSTVLKSVQQLQAMIRDLLEASRVESGKLRIEPRCIAIDGLVQQAVAMMEQTAKRKRISMTVDLDGKLQFAYADPDRVLQVLINLIDNAIKFTPPEGSIVVKACLVDTDPNFIYLSVADTGRGISPEARHLIFERLHQEANIDSSRTGLGLGLHISKELVKLHGGRIWVTSQPGQGSVFTFTVPLFSLSKLLFPVITYQGRLRENIVLLKVELIPDSEPSRATWENTCRQCRELLERCIYVDKDLIVPISGNTDSRQALFVAASTDLERAEIMMKRIREQLQSNTDLKIGGSVQISATAVPMPPVQSGDQALEVLVQAVADNITEQIRLVREVEQRATTPTRS